MIPDPKALLERIDAADKRCQGLLSRVPDGDSSKLPRADAVEAIARLSSTIEALTPPGHRFRKLMAVSLDRHGLDNPENIDRLLGLLRALRAELADGHFYIFGELVRGDLFAEYIDIADHLLSEGLKDAASVIAGGTLESHLRQLCLKHGIPLKRSTGAPMLLSDMRRELCNRRVTEALDNTSLDTWTMLRNQAAHGDYKKYSDAQVRLMIDGIRDFIRRMPA